MKDKHSLSSYQSHKAIRAHYSLDTDFDHQKFSGYAEYTFEIIEAQKDILSLDTKALNIIKVVHDGVSVPFSQGENHPSFGSGLHIQLPESIKSLPVSSHVTLQIHFETTSSSSAIQWLSKEQTADKKQPFVLTQCEAIHCRSLVPCQDTPAIKIPYTADLTVPNEELTGLMSALLVKSESLPSGKKTFFFKQEVPVPSYLLAIAVGALQFRSLEGDDPKARCGVWAEGSVVDAAAKEFEKTAVFLKAAEEICQQPYVWGRYDLLVLPPSFPFGGMENPCLTFVTPTLLAGDGSLANVVAHEIAHSWMGNLVTNGSWEDFWLNEGFTVYVERQICKVVEGRDVAQLQAMIGYHDLKETLDSFGWDSALTKLKPLLDGVDPDDSFSSVPYEKGFNLLYYLQVLVAELAGRPKEDDSIFLAWLGNYIQTFKGKVLTTEEFVAHFVGYFSKGEGGVVIEGLDKKVEWNKWFNTPGLPPVENHFDETLAKHSKDLAALWVESEDEGALEAKKGALDSASSTQKIYFLDQLIERSQKKKLSVGRLEKLGHFYGLAASKNSELRYRWCTLLLQHKQSAIFEKVVEFVTSQGRMKFVRPLYRELASTGDEGLKTAVTTFEAHQNFYHSICGRLVKNDLEAIKGKGKQ